MTHRFPIKEIAAQAGVGLATVDRAINGRAHVSPQMRQRIDDAIRELETQESLLSARGRRMFVDIVVEAPARFSREVRIAADRVAPYVPQAALRVRYAMRERMSTAETLAQLRRIRKIGSDGVILKARDVAEVRAEIDALAERRIPVVTVFTDVRAENRVAYCGMDNRKAGETAAYIAATALAGQGGCLLLTRSDESFLGEDERAKGFAERLARLAPSISLLDLTGGAGLDRTTGEVIATALLQRTDIIGCYSMGGGNAAILRAFEQAGRPVKLFIGHDLDDDNAVLLGQGRIGWILGHDLDRDLRFAFEHIVAAHGLGRKPAARYSSDITVITPFNQPDRAPPIRG